MPLDERLAARKVPPLWVMKRAEPPELDSMNVVVPPLVVTVALPAVLLPKKYNSPALFTMVALPPVLESMNIAA